MLGPSASDTANLKQLNGNDENIRKIMKNDVFGHKKFVMAAQALKFSKMEQWHNLRKGSPEVIYTKTHR